MKKVNPMAVLALALCAGHNANAELSTHLGMSAGLSDISIDGGGISDAVNAAFDASLLFNDWIGINLGASRLGEFEINGANDDKLIYDSAHVALALRGDFVFGAEIYANLGMHYTDWTVDYEAGTDKKDHANGATYQVGIYMPIAKHFGITTSWQYYDAIDIEEGFDETISSSVNAYRLGIQASF